MRTATERTESTLKRTDVGVTYNSSEVTVKKTSLVPIEVRTGGFKQVLGCYWTKTFRSHLFGHAPYSAWLGSTDEASDVRMSERGVILGHEGGRPGSGPNARGIRSCSYLRRLLDPSQERILKLRRQIQLTASNSRPESRSGSPPKSHPQPERRPRTPDLALAVPVQDRVPQRTTAGIAPEPEQAPLPGRGRPTNDHGRWWASESEGQWIALKLRRWADLGNELPPLRPDGRLDLPFMFASE